MSQNNYISFDDCLKKAKKEFDQIERTPYEKRILKIKNFQENPTRKVTIGFIDGLKTIEVNNHEYK